MYNLKSFSYKFNLHLEGKKKKSDVKIPGNSTYTRGSRADKNVKMSKNCGPLKNALNCDIFIFPYFLLLFTLLCFVAG